MKLKKKMVTKKVKNTEYEVLKYLTQFLTITEIAKQRKVSRTAIYKVIYRLIDKGLVRKIGKAYEVTDRGLHYLNRYSPNLIRLHNLAFKISIITKPNNWELKRSKIVQLRVLSKQVNLNNNSYEIHNFRNLKIKTTNNSIIFYMPTIYGKNTDICFSEALEMLFKSIPKIESLFKVTLIKDRKTNIEIISQHYAKLQDIIAKKYRTEGNKLYVKDDEGNLRIIADYSFRVDELEAIYNKTAKEDMDVMQNFIKELLNTPVTTTKLMEMIRGVTANQMIYAKNMESHISAIKELGKGVRELSKLNKLHKKSRSRKLNQKTLFDF